MLRIEISHGSEGSETKDRRGLRSVAVVEDDDGTRSLLAQLLEDNGFDVRSYVGPLEYLSEKGRPEPSCILLDVRLPDMSGLDLQERLKFEGSRSVIVFMSAFAEVSMSVRAMKAGALDFMQKPFREQEVLDAVCRANDAYGQRLRLAEAMASIGERLNSLTAREKEVLGGVVDGLLNKQIAAALGISEVMVKVHRGNVMRKMRVRTLADLIKQLSPHPSFHQESLGFSSKPFPTLLLHA